MAKFPLELSKFKKISADNNTAVLKHPHGHTIHIALGALDPKTKKQIDTIPTVKMDDGGKVPGSSGASGIPGGSGSPYMDPKKAKEMQDSANQSGWQPQKWLDNTKKELGLDNGGDVNQENPKLEESKKEPAKPKKKMADGGDPGEIMGDVAQDEQPQSPPAEGGLDQYINQATSGEPVQPQGEAANPSAPTSPNPMAAPPQVDTNRMPAEDASNSVGSASKQAAMDQSTPSLMGGYGQQVKGIEQEAAAKGKLGTAQAGILQEAANIKQQQMDEFNKNYQALDAERHAHIADIQKGFVDPDKYWENHSKLAAGLGVILAGFNPKGGPNQALGFVNDNINRSIQAQAKNLDAQNNLLSANLHQFGNLKDATAMTRVMMNDVMANKLDMEAAKAQDPLAKARALQLKGQLQMQVVPELMNLSMRQALIKAGQQGNGGSNQDEMLSYLRVLNPAAAKEIETRYVPGVGTASVPIPDKTREELQARQSLQDQVHNLRQWSQQHSGELKALSPADVNYGQALANSVQDQYRRANGQGVFREAEADFVKGIVADDPTAFFNKYRTDPKYRALEDSNRMQLNGLKKSFGLPTASAESELTPQQQGFVKWARENPNNPKSAMLLKKLGIH